MYVPVLYLKELLRKEGFNIIRVKYEFLAKGDPYHRFEGKRQENDDCSN